MSILTEGTRLSSVYLTDEYGEHRVFKGPHGATAITVTMEYGQMSMVPWARVERNDGSVLVVNLAECLAVELLDKGGA